MSSRFGNNFLTPIQYFEPETKAHIDRMTGDYSHGFKNDLNHLIKKLKDDGVWDVLDVICVVHEAEADSLLDLKNLSDATNVNSMTFTSDRGFAGDGLTSYINSNYAPNGDGVNCVDASNSLFVYVNTHDSSSSFHGAHEAGTVQNTISLQVNHGIWVPGSPGINTNASGSFVSEELITVNLTKSDSPAQPKAGFIGGARTSNIYQHIRIDDEVANNATVGTYTIPNIDMYVSARNESGAAANFSDSRTAAWGYGGGLDGSQLSDLKDAIQIFMEARGAEMDLSEPT